ncbi:gas vesicle protein [Kribbella jejuensis]|uniref:Gas vesicle protein GvpO n=1 Tax=Kribbella jejuensis TaxID=236068 RepID=A0A542E7I5_9ACTN|nr:gas vesicle protein [Kribbella jejuensis]TQJ11298.1 gas vesicle protein GvpO [Kribbella jejuensis]
MATTRKATQGQPTNGRPKTARTARNGSSQAPRRTKPQQSLRSIAIAAARELSQLIGQPPEGIVAVEKRDESWFVQVEVVESHRIPSTTDILAVYEVEVDADGAVTGYWRKDRYVRGRIQE